MRPTDPLSLIVRWRRVAVATAAACLAFGAAAQAPAVTSPPLFKQDARTKVAEHVYVILDEDRAFVTNSGIVAGSKATLVIDTGMGNRNGEILLGEARKVSKNTDFYVAATHFHPEHDLGANGFPPSAKMLRWRGQQVEDDEDGARTIEQFKGFSPAAKELLDGAAFRPADVLFDDAITLDLGGLHVKLFGVGPNHTRGDTAFFVVEDKILFTGDTVMPVFPAVSGPSGSIKKWLANLVEYEALQPVVVVPAHGKLIDTSYIRRYRGYLSTVQMRVAAEKRGGATLEATQAKLAPTLAMEFADLAPANGAPTGRINQAIQAAYREAP
ncbi:MAG TPA: MBL fold metallo-hydrolase [Gammaproteobacteria bacterium]|nr:MBL fold metallo-hydrolase [Gammaproteobacteria bacterium]